jgi:hypothetical protein
MPLFLLCLSIRVFFSERTTTCWHHLLTKNPYGSLKTLCGILCEASSNSLRLFFPMRYPFFLLNSSGLEIREKVRGGGTKRDQQMSSERTRMRTSNFSEKRIQQKEVRTCVSLSLFFFFFLHKNRQYNLHCDTCDISPGFVLIPQGESTKFSP